MGEPVGRRKGTHQIHIDVVETAMRNLERLEWGPDVLLNLRGLTRDAGLSPDTHLLAEAVPDKLGSHELP